MSKVKLFDDVDVELVECSASDDQVVRAARISTLTERVVDDEPGKTAGMINFLMKNRHGTPFEHNMFTFRIKAPIFVFREFHRHRIGWSYNEMSGRYTELLPEFYVPAMNRPIVQEGKPGHYSFTAGSKGEWMSMPNIVEVYEFAWGKYQDMLSAGIAKEIARMVLPVGIMSQMYATCNARSLMAFLSLRTKDETSKFPSYPMQEIEMVARNMEAFFSDRMPLTHEAFQKNGRVSP